VESIFTYTSEREKEMKAFVIDLSICNGCYCCQIACKDEHVGNDWTPYAKPQPDTGQFWIGITESVRGSVPKVKVSYLPKLCMHCVDAACMKQCDVGAIYRREDGIVVIDPTQCTGCKLCADTCPYNAIYFNDALNLAQKCTGCAHLLEDGWKAPRCVDACPTEALKFGEEAELKQWIDKADVYRPELKQKTRVHYLHIPKKFIGGTVYDPAAEEVIIGATCTLTDSQSGETVTVTTDGYGDFWFNGLKDDRVFSLKMEKDGKVKSIDAISTAKDVNLGDIPLFEIIATPNCCL
jgi:tetrathionate reductase subunit B